MRSASGAVSECLPMPADPVTFTHHRWLSSSLGGESSTGIPSREHALRIACVRSKRIGR